MPSGASKTEHLSEPTPVRVPYGCDYLGLTLPVGTMLLQPDDPQPQMTLDRYRRLLSAGIAQTGPDLSRPILVVTDKTRLCAYPDYLPITVALINEVRGVSEPFPIIIAYGTHPRQSDEESLQCYGKLYRDWSFTHHDCDDIGLFTECGTTSRGTPIRLRRDLLQASAVITMGPICHHYFAGYGGGRKLIFPGCGQRDAIYRNHGLFLDRRRRQLAPRCHPGVMEANPIADDLFEIEDHLPAALAIHGLQDSHGRICDFSIGSGRDLYDQACRRHARAFEVTVPPQDIVIASCGGFPKDINFIQAHKALHNSAAFVSDGGRLVVFAQCRDGIGSPTFLPWFTTAGFTGAFDRLAAHYEGNGGTALAMHSKTRRIRIALISDIDEQTCRLIGVEKWGIPDVERLLAGPVGRIAWLENASLLVSQQSY
jgi:lactate racemase